MEKFLEIAMGLGIIMSIFLIYQAIQGLIDKSLEWADIGVGLGLILFPFCVYIVLYSIGSKYPSTEGLMWFIGLLPLIILVGWIIKSLYTAISDFIKGKDKK